MSNRAHGALPWTNNHIGFMTNFVKGRKLLWYDLSTQPTSLKNSLLEATIAISEVLKIRYLVLTLFLFLPLLNDVACWMSWSISETSFYVLFSLHNDLSEQNRCLPYWVFETIYDREVIELQAGWRSAVHHSYLQQEHGSYIIILKTVSTRCWNLY